MKLNELYNQLSEMGDPSKIKKGEIAFHGLLGAVRVLSINGNVAEVAQIKGGKHAKVQLTSLSVEEEALEEQNEYFQKQDDEFKKRFDNDPARLEATLQKHVDELKRLRADPKAFKSHIEYAEKMVRKYGGRNHPALQEGLKSKIGAATLAAAAVLSPVKSSAYVAMGGTAGVIASNAAAAASRNAANGVAVANANKNKESGGDWDVDWKKEEERLKAIKDKRKQLDKEVEDEQKKDYHGIKTMDRVDVQLEKGLSRDEALKLAPWKKSYGDRRGFSYNPKTGKATWL